MRPRRIWEQNVSRKTLAGIALVLLMYGSEELETRDNLTLGYIGLDDCADDGQIYVLRTDVMRCRDHSDINICDNPE
jgi:hypothetical protein